MNQNNKGFIKTVVIVIIVVVIGVVGYFAFSKKSGTPDVNLNNQNPTSTISNTSTVTKISYPDIKTFLPSKAILNGELKLDIDGDGVDEVAFAYATSFNRGNIDFNTGVRVLKYVDSSDWKVVLEDTDVVGNVGGPKSTVDIKKVSDSGTSSKGAVLVVLNDAGAGTATRWHLIASVSGKISKLDPSLIRQKVLADRGYQDWGYNSVKSAGNFVIETQPGYSKNTARCCPDKPPIEIKFKFTGNSIELDSVRELEFKS